MENNIFNRLVYLDHNVLDLMSKGGLKNIEELFTVRNHIAVFSSENLNEIRKSVGYENSFLEVLESIGAKHIVPDLDVHFNYTGTAQIYDTSPKDAFNSYIENYTETPEFGYGLQGMLRKMFGGLNDTSFSEIFDRGAKDIESLVDISDEDIDELDIENSKKEEMKEILSRLPEVIREVTSYTGEALDNEALGNGVNQLQETTGIGPVVLKNISEPDILLKVWDKIESAIPGEAGTLEKFFAIDQSDWSHTPNRKLSIVEKVNAIYHQLNYVGYYRDSQMKKERRFNASFCDMTHAGLATFCKILVSRDEDLIMKAAAAYEYLNLETRICHMKS